MRIFVWIGMVLTGVVILGMGSNVKASDTTSAKPAPPVFGPHDGVVAMTKQHAFETVFAAGGMCVYMFDTQMAPMMMQRVKATATVAIKGSPSQEASLKLDGPKEGERILYFCPMHPTVAQSKPGTCELCGGMELIPQDCIRAVFDLSKASPGSVSAVVTIKGMKGSEPDVAYTAVWSEPPKK